MGKEEMKEAAFRWGPLLTLGIVVLTAVATFVAHSASAGHPPLIKSVGDNVIAISANAKAIGDNRTSIAVMEVSLHSIQTTQGEIRGDLREVLRRLPPG